MHLPVRRVPAAQNRRGGCYVTSGFARVSPPPSALCLQFAEQEGRTGTVGCPISPSALCRHRQGAGLVASTHPGLLLALSLAELRLSRVS